MLGNSSVVRVEELYFARNEAGRDVAVGPAPRALLLLMLISDLRQSPDGLKLSHMISNFDDGKELQKDVDVLAL